MIKPRLCRETEAAKGSGNVAISYPSRQILLEKRRPTSPYFLMDATERYFFSEAEAFFICAIFCARPAAYFWYWTLSTVNVPNI